MLSVLPDEYFEFRKIIGLFFSIAIFLYMIFHFCTAMGIYFKKCNSKSKNSKSSLLKRIKKNGIVMQ